VIEAALHYTEALEAADRAALFKTFVKVLAQRRGLMATFMAKWSQQLPGQSGHLHLSMARADGSAAFHDPQQPRMISDQLRWFVGGQQALMPELLAMVACNRQQLLAPGAGLLGADRRHLGHREPHLRAAGDPGRRHSQRVEYRRRGRHQSVSCDRRCDRLGLVGHRAQIEPDEPISGNAYERTLPAKRQLPRTLGEAARAAGALQSRRSSCSVKPFVAHFAASREWEEREFHRSVTDWELSRYFEII
jgi:glutamine synthetase